MAPSVKLTYFDLQGRGELTRLMLKAGKVNFEDCRIPFSEWPPMKPTTPFGGLPLLNWDGEVIAQQMAIVRFVAKKVGLAGKTELEFAYADMIVEHVNDFMAKLVPMRFPKTDRDELVSSFLDDFLPGWLDTAENFLKKRGGVWFNGSGLSFGDLAMMVFLTFLTHPEEKSFAGMDNADRRAAVLDSRPLLKGNLQRVMEVDEIALYLRSRPAFKGL
eukprot:TRINITY_DN4035_c0_g1_i1.p1 TRINITY_DN4035_c0_g1~~TRINITY_DN4035_c0_g1_i1.p1  ORF type:complete len:217 (-),score=62.96 TRINITY_DN4035_c0_g1_i1:95-745(-)